MKIISLRDKLAAIERCIEDFREARNHPETLEHETLVALKAIALDLRARLDTAPSVTEVEVERRIRAVLACPQHLSESSARAWALVHEITTRWPTIKQALEKFGAMEETG